MKEMENIQARTWFLKSFFSLCLEEGMGTDFMEHKLRSVNKKTGKRCEAAQEQEDAGEQDNLTCPDEVFQSYWDKDNVVSIS